MARKTKLEINNFTKGLITEAGPLTFPDNASLVDENFILNKDGSRQRRLGLDYEDDYEENLFAEEEPAILASHIWKNPTQTGAFDIVVIQEHDTLYFYNASADPVSGSPVYVDGFGGGLGIALPASYVEGTPIVTASLRGQLIIAYGGPDVLVLDYDVNTDEITQQTVQLKVRDVWGIDDGLKVDERITVTFPITSLTDDEAYHVYNLRNQGWPAEAKVTDSDGSVVQMFDPIIVPTYDPDETGDFVLASNADVFFYGKSSSGTIPEAVGAFSAFELSKQVFGNTPATKGKFVIDLFSRSTSRQAHYEDNLGEVPTGNDMREDISEGSITQVASYAGRFFYAVEEIELQGGDDRTPKLNTMILFSQVVKSDSNLGACYSEADPTSEHVFDTVATDGGFLFIPDAGKVLRLAPLGESLFVICSNGVWEIHGGEQIFSATNVNLAKTSTIGAVSGLPVVTSESVLTYWAEGGIYLISIDQTSLRGLATNITINTIQRLYTAIPASEKRKVIGIFDEVDRKIRWLYNSTTSVYPRKFTRELIFDVDLRAFSVHVFSTDFQTTYSVIGFFTNPSLKYIIQRSIPGSIYYSFGSYKNTEFMDFGAYDSPAVLVTGYLTGNTGSSEKRILSLVTHFKRTETGFADGGGGSIVFANPSGCLLTPQWEWTNSAAAGKWGAPFQAYRLPRPYYPTGVEDPFDYSYTVITSKHGLRGRGRALSLKFESEEGKDLVLLGWGLEIEVDEKF